MQRLRALPTAPSRRVAATLRKAARKRGSVTMNLRVIVQVIAYPSQGYPALLRCHMPFCQACKSQDLRGGLAN